MSPEEFARIEMLVRSGLSERKACGNATVRRAYQRYKRQTKAPAPRCETTRVAPTYKIEALGYLEDSFFARVANEAMNRNDPSALAWCKLFLEVLRVLPSRYNEKQQNVFTPDVYKSVLESLSEDKQS